MSLNFAQPYFEVLEGLPVGDVKHQKHSMGALVVGGKDGLEFLLPSCVPHLKLYFASRRLNGPYFEVNPDGGQEAVRENILSEPGQ